MTSINFGKIISLFWICPSCGELHTKLEGFCICKTMLNHKEFQPKEKIYVKSSVS